MLTPSPRRHLRGKLVSLWAYDAPGTPAGEAPRSGYQLKISPIWRQALLLASAAPKKSICLLLSSARHATSGPIAIAAALPQKKSICLLLSSARHSPKEHGPHFTRLPQSTYCHERVIVVSASTTGPGSLRSVAFDAAVQAQVQENSVGLGKAGKPRTPSKRSNALGTPAQMPSTFLAKCRRR